jgi:hypothetical protein
MSASARTALERTGVVNIHWASGIAGRLLIAIKGTIISSKTTIPKMLNF